jgi:hypothetical protein
MKTPLSKPADACTRNLLEGRKDGLRVAEDKGQRTLLHVMARVGLTQEEALQASFKSHCVRRRHGCPFTDTPSNRFTL